MGNDISTITTDLIQRSWSYVRLERNPRHWSPCRNHQQGARRHRSASLANKKQQKIFSTSSTSSRSSSSLSRRSNCSSSSSSSSTDSLNTCGKKSSSSNKNSSNRNIKSRSASHSNSFSDNDRTKKSGTAAAGIRRWKTCISSSNNKNGKKSDLLKSADVLAHEEFDIYFNSETNNNNVDSDLQGQILEMCQSISKNQPIIKIDDSSELNHDDDSYQKMNHHEQSTVNDQKVRLSRSLPKKSSSFSQRTSSLDLPCCFDSRSTSEKYESENDGCERFTIEKHQQQQLVHNRVKKFDPISKGSGSSSLDLPNVIRLSESFTDKGQGGKSKPTVQRRRTITTDRPVVIRRDNDNDESEIPLYDKPVMSNDIPYNNNNNSTTAAKCSLRHYSGGNNESSTECATPTFPVCLLTPAQITLIRQHWNQTYTARGPIVIGMHVFHRACFKTPAIKQLFKCVKLSKKFPNVDHVYKQHAKSIGELIDEIVKNLDNLDGIVPKLREIGRNHARFYFDGLWPNYWDTFAEAFIDCTLEWGEKIRRVEEARKAWAIIISYIVDRMKAGFLDGRRDLIRTNAEAAYKIYCQKSI